LRAASALRARYDDARRPSALRKISLTRLEKQVQLRLAAGRPPTETMQVLAGLQRIRYVFVYPETGDLVLAGPAGDWKTDAEDRVVSADGGQPVVRLDDLVVVFRHVVASGDGQFGCLIVPRQEGLQRLRAFIDESSKAPLKPGQRPAWLAQLRSSLGRQDIEVYGLDPRTRAARVMVEADYRMKLVGMGLEPGVPGVESYLASIELGPGQSPPPMGVLRWWFTLDYDALLTGAGGQAFAIRGQGVRVLSENELLTRQGQRVHTGTSDVLNKRFADSFTAHFEALAQKYPVYAELRNLFDLALVAALVDEQDLAGRVGWHLTCFGPGGGYPVASGEAPREVETVINHRVIGGVNVVAGVSGGVRADPVSLVRPSAVETEGDGRLSAGQAAAAPKDLPPGAWWWD
jgi:hypothetical protein